MAPRKAAFQHVHSALDGAEWEFDGLGAVRLSVASSETARRVDHLWTASRTVEAASNGWCWYDICAAAEDRFAVSTGEETVAMWSAKTGVLLDGACFYRVDRIEVAPHRHRQGYGFASFYLLATRAREVAATGIVLAALPEACEFYERLGGVQHRPRGWHSAPGLVPFLFDSSRLEEIASDADRFRKHG